MPAYIIARIKVTDPQKYEDYKALAPAAIAAHGGRYLVRGGPVRTLEGEPETLRIAVLEFPSVEAAQTFYRSTDYGAAKAKREGAAEGQFILVEGYTG